MAVTRLWQILIFFGIQSNLPTVISGTLCYYILHELRYVANI